MGQTSRAAGEPGREGGIQVIARAASILRALTPGGMSLGRLALATGLPRSTVQRIVEALAAESLVEIGGTGVRRGAGLQALARMVPADVAGRARPHLEALFAATRETVDISTSQGREVVFLDRIVSDHELRVVPVTDRASPLHAMANGKAILSGMEDGQVAGLLRRGLAALTPATVTGLPALLAELAEIRREGFSYDREEHAVGICAIGVPVLAPGLPTHALSVAVPAARFEASLPVLKAALLACRSALERTLSGH